MSVKLHSFLVAAVMLTVSSAWGAEVKPGALNAFKTEEKAIQQLLNTYGAALNASDAEKITSLYTQEGRFVAPGLPTATGTTEIKNTYEGIYKAISLQLQFTPAQIVVVNPHSAYATSTSSGPVKVSATGQVTVNNYRELWIFKKEQSQWKIDCYLFNQP